jgi:hypothetical protein
VLCLWRIATLLEAQSSAISTPGYPHKIARSHFFSSSDPFVSLK